MQLFLPFLPDTGGQAAEALAATLEDVEWLLSVDAAEFWMVVSSDPSLVTLVDTYLRHAPRPYDDGFQDLSGVDHALWRHMLGMLHRMFAAREAGSPPHSDRASLLSRLSTVPALLDACALYGAGTGVNSGGASVAAVAAAMLSLRPQLPPDLAVAGQAIASNVAQVVDACLTAARSSARDPAVLRSLVDGVSYLRDTCLTLCALLRVLPGAAASLLRHGAGLVESLGAAHDQLLPTAASAAASGSTAAHALLCCRCLHVEVASESAVHLLLTHAFLDAAAAAGGLGSAGSSSGGGGAAGSSSSGSGLAVARGEAFLEAVMLLGHREGESAGAGAPPGMSLAPALAHRHGLAASIQAAQHSGRVSLDDAQVDYLAALMGLPGLGAAPVLLPSQHGPAAAGASASGSAATAGAAVQLSLVAQVLDLLPDYGEGFVAAALAALGGSVEATVNALLEGMPPREIQHLDRNLSYQQYRQEYGRGETADAAPPTSDADARQGGNRGGGSGRGRRPENLTALYLDTKEDKYRGSVAAAAVESQWEYDDEYDDSMDELLSFGADGLAEAEGEGDAEGGGAAGLALDRGMRSLMLQPGTATFQPGGREGGGGRGGGRGGQQQGTAGRLWVLGDKIYNYPKPGAVEAGSAAEAEGRTQAAKQATLEIHGLGPGGNVPFRPQAAAAEGGEERQQQAGRGGGSGRGRGIAAGGRGRGGDASSSHGWKDKHKAAVGNHHRKDRAAQKQARGMQ